MCLLPSYYSDGFLLDIATYRERDFGCTIRAFVVDITSSHSSLDQCLIAQGDLALFRYDEIKLSCLERSSPKDLKK